LIREGRTVLVTGSTDGIGKETAMQLAQMGATVLLHGRDPKKGKVVLEEIHKKTGSDLLEFYLADLSSRQQIRSLAAEVRENNNRLDVLINNAGIFMPERKMTEEGIETTFTVNYLAPFLLTLELLDLLKRSRQARIISVASIAHWNAKLEWDNLQGERHYEGFDAYALSKLGVILFTYALAERLLGNSVTANCLHPGVIETKLLRAGFGDYPGDTPERGARTSVYLASSQKVEGVTGQYYEECKPTRSSPASYDREMQDKLWRISEDLIGLV
jgi:NAD(P)-dependent dehydrogenase (short-subunit alcohol dehydrogenase family)